MTPRESSTADFADVVDWLEGRLDPQAAAALERLVLVGDREVLATVAWWRRFRAASSLTAEPVPDALATRLRSLRLDAGAGPSRDPSWLDRLVGTVRARLSFDSLHTPGLAMARSTLDATRQLVFSAPGLDIAVDVSETHGDELTAVAQLLPLDDGVEAAGVWVRTWAHTGLLSEQRSDALGRIELGVLPSDVVILEVDRSPAWAAVQAELDLRPPA